MQKQKILPFYMTYPLPLFAQEEDSMMRDLEYMQQLYPVEAKEYQKRIASVLDKLDYEGSMIYDEYPCKWQLYRLTQNIMTILKQEERDAAGRTDSRIGNRTDNRTENRTDNRTENRTDNRIENRTDNRIENEPYTEWSTEKEKWVEQMIQILLYIEIYKRRHKREKNIVVSYD